MDRIIITLILLFLTMPSFGQIGLIDDPDGFTNVRKGRGTNSEILYQVKENEVFFIYEEDIIADSNWIEVWIPTDKFSRKTIDYSTPDIHGYIYKSRIKPIESLPVAENNVPILTFEIQNADTTKELTTSSFGLEIPLSMSFEVKSLSLSWNEELRIQESKLFGDLFNVTFKEGIYKSNGDRFTTYRQGKTYFIKQSCADGAGYYDIVWVVQNGEIIQRLAGGIY